MSVWAPFTHWHTTRTRLTRTYLSRIQFNSSLTHHSHTHSLTHSHITRASLIHSHTTHALTYHSHNNRAPLIHWHTSLAPLTHSRTNPPLTHLSCTHAPLTHHSHNNRAALIHWHTTLAPLEPLTQQSCITHTLTHHSHTSHTLMHQHTTHALSHTVYSHTTHAPLIYSVWTKDSSRLVSMHSISLRVLCWGDRSPRHAQVQFIILIVNENALSHCISFHRWCTHDTCPSIAVSLGLDTSTSDLFSSTSATLAICKHYLCRDLGHTVLKRPSILWGCMIFVILMSLNLPPISQWLHPKTCWHTQNKNNIEYVESHM